MKNEPMNDNQNREHSATWLDLYDYRRRIAAMYHEREKALRAGEDEQRVLDKFRANKDEIFAQHPQSPLSIEQRGSFTGLSYFPYNPDLRIEALLKPEQATDEVILLADGPHTLPMRRAARLEFVVEHTPVQLVVYWLDVYGGGLFLPFRDATCPDESYGGGRYLFDTVKGSDLLRQDSEFGAESKLRVEGEDVMQGYAGGRVVLDFNYAYNPSCAYNSQWACPLAPRENWLPVPIRAGERR